MNPHQKSYDSYDKTNKLLKLTNSYYHFRNLEFIKNRKPQDSNAPAYFQKSKTLKKQRQTTLFDSYYIKQQNQNIKKKLNKILLRPIKPKMNDYFLTKETKIQKVRQLHKEIFDKQRNEDNEYYKQRIKNQKAFINPKLMDQNYNTEHVKALMKLRKIGENENVVLPQIKNSSDNPSIFDYHKIYSNTESVFRSAKDNESNTNKMKNVNGSSVSNTYYGNHNKDSGTDSVDK